ncbi:MAG: hypothetical protein ACP5QK_06295 [Myxococcota bacterium]
MAKIIIYKSESRNKVLVVDKIERSGLKIKQVISELNFKGPTLFLNNEKTEDFEYSLKEEDLLFIFT